jgi:hypothetical protein
VNVTVARTDGYGTTWLCRPVLADDPCTSDLDSTTVPATGALTVHDYSPAASSKFDCFYVYPTVSKEGGANANLAVQPAEVNAAVEQASRFSQVCNVWAPMYRQRTLDAILSSGVGSAALRSTVVAYDSVLSGWEDYIDHYNDGRPFILIGHSQGAAMLILLLQRAIATDPSVLKRMVSAIIVGGNVEVPTGGSVGGTFSSVPACRSQSQTGCVIAYSSFYDTPPSTSLFGRPGQGVSLQSGQTGTTGLQVLCTNPAALGGGTGTLDPYFAVSNPLISTPWAELPDLYTASCDNSDGASFLKISVVRSAGRRRPIVHATLGPNWGLHVDDINLALGNLVEDVAAEESSFSAG